MVLMLEPLHACNLRCAGCGRIREYASTLGQTLSVEECLEAARECGAPIVSVCGGEPLLYQELPTLLDLLVQAGKHLYLCTNGQMLEPYLPKLLAVKNRRLRSRCFLNVHLDGPPALHDAITGTEGSFERAMTGIVAAKKAGFRVYTNTTVYRQAASDGSSFDEKGTVATLVELAERLAAVKIDGMMISPGYGYQAVLEEQTRPLPTVDDSFFLTRSEIEALFRLIRVKMKKYRLTATPMFLDFLSGDLSLPCAAWANPTRNVAGWRAPCYLIGDAHYRTYREWLEKTDWEKIGPANDPRCRNCMTHCGFEPSAVLAPKNLGQLLKLARWQICG